MNDDEKIILEQCKDNLLQWIKDGINYMYFFEGSSDSNALYNDGTGQGAKFRLDECFIFEADSTLANLEKELMDSTGDFIRKEDMKRFFHSFIDCAKKMSTNKENE